MATASARQREIDRNSRAFTAMQADIADCRQGQFALMRGGAIVAWFDTSGDAITAGKLLCEDQIFSVQEMTTERAHVGFWTHALRVR